MLLTLTIAALLCNFLSWRNLPGSRFNYGLIPDRVGKFFKEWEDSAVAASAITTLHLAVCLCFGAPVSDWIMDLNGAWLLLHVIGRCGYCIFRREFAAVEEASSSCAE